MSSFEVHLLPDACVHEISAFKPKRCLIFVYNGVCILSLRSFVRIYLKERSSENKLLILGIYYAQCLTQNFETNIK